MRDHGLQNFHSGGGSMPRISRASTQPPLRSRWLHCNTTHLRAVTEGIRTCQQESANPFPSPIRDCTALFKQRATDQLATYCCSCPSCPAKPRDMGRNTGRLADHDSIVILVGTGEMITHGCQWCKSISISLGICRSTRRFTEASWHRSCAIVHLSCARGPMRLQHEMSLRGLQVSFPSLSQGNCCDQRRQRLGHGACYGLQDFCTHSTLTPQAHMFWQGFGTACISRELS